MEHHHEADSIGNVQVRTLINASSTRDPDTSMAMKRSTAGSKARSSSVTLLQALCGIASSACSMTQPFTESRAGRFVSTSVALCRSVSWSSIARPCTTCTQQPIFFSGGKTYMLLVTHSCTRPHGVTRCDP